MKKTLIVANSIALVITVAINYLSSAGIFNGTTVEEISDRYHNLFTPASYAFAIWGLIYLSLLAFVIYTIVSDAKNSNDNNIVLRIGWWFVLSCIANCLWIVSWINDYIGLSVLLMVVLLFSLIMIIFKTNMEIDHAPRQEIAFVWWPFSLYSGWISVALIADIAAFLTKSDWNGFGIPKVTWTIIMICVAGILNLLITWIRNMREFALVGCWALIAIAVGNWHAPYSIATAGIIVAAVLFISTTIHGYRNRKSNPWLQQIK